MNPTKETSTNLFAWQAAAVALEADIQKVEDAIMKEIETLHSVGLDHAAHALGNYLYEASGESLIRFANIIKGEGKETPMDYFKSAMAVYCLDSARQFHKDSVSCIDLATSERMMECDRPFWLNEASKAQEDGAKAWRNYAVIMSLAEEV